MVKVGAVDKVATPEQCVRLLQGGDGDAATRPRACADAEDAGGRALRPRQPQRCGFARAAQQWDAYGSH